MGLVDAGKRATPEDGVALFWFLREERDWTRYEVQPPATLRVTSASNQCAQVAYTRSGDGRVARWDYAQARAYRAAVPHLFDPLRVREITIPNRIGVSPMCQYSSTDGLATNWHLVHLGSRAVGGAGVVIAEATAVTPVGRISPSDLGLWSDAHAEALAPIAEFISDQGSVPGIQLAHAGRKASTARLWEGGAPVAEDAGGWEPVGCTGRPFSSSSLTPRRLKEQECDEIPQLFARAAARAVASGFRFIEIHGAHGYLLHEFLSPLSNQRTDRYGGSLDDRMRLLLETTREVRAAIGEALPLSVRISATDWETGGLDLAECVRLASTLRDLGADVVDCSSGGNSPHPRIPVGAGYQVPFAEEIRKASGILTAAVGLITSAAQADEVIRNGRADLVLLGRELLRDPYWPLRAAPQVRKEPRVPPQYRLAFR